MAGPALCACIVITVVENRCCNYPLFSQFVLLVPGKNRSNRVKQSAAPTQDASPSIGPPAGGAGSAPVAGATSISHVFSGPYNSSAGIPIPVPASAGGVLLDDDFLARTGGFPTVLDEASKLFLNQAVYEDTRFLCSLKVRIESVDVCFDMLLPRMTVVEHF